MDAKLNPNRHNVSFRFEVDANGRIPVIDHKNDNKPDTLRVEIVLRSIFAASPVVRKRTMYLHNFKPNEIMAIRFIAEEA